MEDEFCKLWDTLKSELIEKADTAFCNMEGADGDDFTELSLTHAITCKILKRMQEIENGVDGQQTKTEQRKEKS